jgi:hypothetical protein
MGFLRRRTKQKEASLERETAVLYSETAVADDSGLTISRSNYFYVDCRLAGFTTGSGTVTVTGLDTNSQQQSIVLIFTANQRKVNLSQRFLSITRVQTSNLANEAAVGTVTIRAVDAGGQPNEEATVVDAFNIRMDRPRIGDALQASGHVPLNSAYAFIHPEPHVVENDILVVDGRRWEVKAVIEQFTRKNEFAYKQLILFAEGQN